MKHKNLKGFTLVELLIVIALIAILSVAVLATLNPAEQANKGRDARVQNDAAEVLGAYERYFAAKGEYPWNFYAGAVGSTNVVIKSTNVGFGICGGANAVATTAFNTDASACDIGGTQNVLVTTGELKSTIVSKDEFVSVLDNTKPEQSLWTVKAADSEMIRVCFIPKSLDSRSRIDSLNCIYSVDGTVTKVNTGSCLPATSADWSSATTAAGQTAILAAGTAGVFKCVP